MAQTVTTTAQPPVVHPKTGLPIQRVETFAVGDLVTTGINGDGYPGVVVAVSAKTVYVRNLRQGDYVIGNVTEGSHANYMDDTTLVVDPAAVERLVALGIGNQDKNAWSDERGADKYVLKVNARPVGTRESGYYPSQRQRDEVGADVFHLARWGRPNANYGYLSKGARYRRDPHF